MSSEEEAPVFKYPKEQGYSAGCKVAWLFYTDEKDAKKASEIAKKAAEYKADLGYDFGYCSPGSIEKDGERFKVCIP